jgi:uncharacterized protein (TIGR02466 family)
MIIENWFSIPVYVSDITGDTLSSIQQELTIAYDDLLINNEFQPHTLTKSHLLSDPTFSTNLLDTYSTDFFKNTLTTHVLNYMKLIDSNIGNARSLDYNISGSWMTLNQENSYAFVHTHNDSDISGVYYYKTNSDDGNLFFSTPNKLMTSSYCFNHHNQAVDYTPVVGRIILFPGWLEHGVRTNLTTNERVSVSFNINFKRN